MSEKPLSGVVLREALVKVQKKWIVRFILANVLYLITIAGLSTTMMTMMIEEKKTNSSFADVSQILEEYRTKDKLYEIMRTKGYSLGQGLDIVEATIRKSRELGLPLALIMAVIHQESEFYPNARSSKGAQGLMQIMPLKWDEYVSKLNLKVDRRAISDPSINITVGCQILKDLYDKYRHLEDPKVRMVKALTDYNSGENAANPNLKYAAQVSRKQEEYDNTLQQEATFF